MAPTTPATRCMLSQSICILFVVAAVTSPASAFAARRSSQSGPAEEQREIREEIERLKSAVEVLRKENDQLKRAMKIKPAAEAKPTANSRPKATGANAEPGVAAVPAGPDAEARLDERLKEMAVDDADPIRNLDRYFHVPNSPAATALGLNPDTLPRAQLPKEFNLSEINGVDVRGNAKTGLAVDIAPAQLFNLNPANAGQPGGGLTVGQYATGEKGVFSDSLDEQWGYWRRVLTRTQISLAGVRGTEAKDRSIRLAAGVNIPLMVSRDVVQTAAEHNAVLAEDGDRRTDRLAEPLAGWEHGAPPFMDNWLGAIANTLWEHTDWAIGAFALATAEKDRGERFRYGGSTYWSTWSFSIHKPEFGSMIDPSRDLRRVRFVANATYRDSELVPLSSTTKEKGKAASRVLVEEDSLLLGGGVQFGSDDLNATLFGAWLRLNDERSGSASATRYGVEFEYRVPGYDNLWITASAGRELGSEHRPDNTFMLGGVKIGLSGDSFKRPF